MEMADRSRVVLEILIDAGVDLVVRRGWYEITDFWSPDLYGRLLAEPLRMQVETAHQTGVKFTYVMNSGAMPLLSTSKEIGFDVLPNIDPVASGTDAGEIKREIGDAICLCGGVNNTHVLEEGTEADVREAVEGAIETLGPETGFILAPGDSPGFVDGTDQAVVRRNIEVMIAAWETAAMSRCLA